MSNRHALIAIALFLGWLGLAHSQTRIYRCGNEYTNSPTAAQMPNCKQVEGGNLTVVQTTKPASGGGASKPARSAASAASGKATDAPSAEQKARDSDAKTILEAELAKAEQKLAELTKDFNNGEPEKQGSEHRNHQKYLDRVAEMQSSIERAKSDIEGIRRELSRLVSR